MVGGGLAGSEAAWALAERGIAVTLQEMRPVRMTAAHHTDRLAELVCSNSFKSVEPTNAHGLLKAEMRRLSSIVLDAADQARVPGGAALAVDRDAALGERPGGLASREPAAHDCGSQVATDSAGAASSTISSCPHFRHLRDTPFALVCFSSMPRKPQLGQATGTGRFHVE